MLKQEFSHNWLGGKDFKSRILLDVFMFSAFINGVVSTNYNHSQLHDIRNLPEKRSGNSERLYEISLSSENERFYNGNVLVSKSFDKMLHWIFENEVEKGGRSCGARKIKLGESIKKRLKRFVGHRKRLQFALLPIMYKMGVMTTLLTGLTVLVLKGLTIGVILLIFAFGHYFTKIHKQPHQSSQPIHVHVHSQDGHSKVTSFPGYESGVGLGPWDRIMEKTDPNFSLQENDLESYRRRLLQNSTAAMLNFNPLLFQGK